MTSCTLKKVSFFIKLNCCQQLIYNTLTLLDISWNTFQTVQGANVFWLNVFVMLSFNFKKSYYNKEIHVNLLFVELN